MEKLLELPPLALITLGCVLAVIIGVRYLGLWQGERSPAAASSNQAQVAAVIVDPTALKEASAAVKGLTATLGQTNIALKRVASNQKAMADEMDQLREEVRVYRESRR